MTLEHIPDAVLDIWLPALRDGSRTQGTGQLCALGGKFCCLGVLLDVHGIPCNEGHDNDGEPISENYARVHQLLGTNPQEMELAPFWYRNDGAPTVGIARHTFPEIADWIETTYRKKD